MVKSCFAVSFSSPCTHDTIRRDTITGFNVD